MWRRIPSVSRRGFPWKKLLKLLWLSSYEGGIHILPKSSKIFIDTNPNHEHTEMTHEGQTRCQGDLNFVEEIDNTLVSLTYLALVHIVDIFSLSFFFVLYIFLFYFYFLFLHSFSPLSINIFSHPIVIINHYSLLFRLTFIF
jgi:hypothetical protein